MPRRHAGPSTPNLDRLTTRERGTILGTLLAAHPDLLSEAEEAAQALLVTVDTEVVAQEVVEALMDISLDELGARAGRQRGRYVEPNEAAWELVEEAFDPFLIDLGRLAGLGHIEAATAMAMALLDGLDRLGQPDGDSVLGYAGPDLTGELGELVRTEAERLGLSIADADDDE